MIPIVSIAITTTTEMLIQPNQLQEAKAITLLVIHKAFVLKSYTISTFSFEISKTGFSFLLQERKENGYILYEFRCWSNI